MTDDRDDALAGWQHAPLDSTLEIHCHDAPPPVPPDLQPLLEAHWQAAQEKAGGRLFDGPVFTLTSVSPARLEGAFVRYKALVAQTREPALFARLGLRALSVCGVLECADGIVLGRRGGGATYQPGMWQLPPAGSVDASARQGTRIDARAQILSELEEEVGLSAAEVEAATPFCLVVHPGTHYHDLGIRLRTPLRGEQVLARQEKVTHREYLELRILPHQDLPGFLDGLAGQVVPTTRILLQRLQLLG
ncbi:hypothetical protein E0493_21690 [Roseomonas sp. M0104]|uniref:Nudix hydrolase domain-containing protein n=1 Tax=Teichococcus coralli TaxID=2545983 RepID=A0A845BIR6_9PROT|nr:hypothetical protein [Pseudoroseomonas coralli]MXP65964.1 hypothetical protein [Pseudoroseomonas coralli]